jgi:hypothetical protein
MQNETRGQLHRVFTCAASHVATKGGTVSCTVMKRTGPLTSLGFSFLFFVTVIPVVLQSCQPCFPHVIFVLAHAIPIKPCD